MDSISTRTPSRRCVADFDRLVSLEERFRRRGDELLVYRDELKAELEAIGDAEDSLPTLLSELESAVKALQKGAQALTSKAQKGAGPPL